MSLEKFLAQLHWRYATKVFDSSKKIPEALVTELLESVRLAPSSYGLQPWKFVVVDNPKIRAELRPHSWNQSQITDASHLVVLCAKKEMTAEDINAFIGDIAKVRKVDVASLSGYRDMMLGSLPSMQGEAGKAWMAKQVYIALGFLLSAAAVAEVDACPMEGFDKDAYNKLLKLPEQGYEAQVVCTLGYRSSSDHYAALPKVRLAASSAVSRI